jgi:hypothetical protein
MVSFILLIFIFVTIVCGKPNVVVEWLILLLCIREVPESNLGLETGYPGWKFSSFSSVPPGKFRYSTLKLGHDRFLPHRLQFIIHLTSFHSTLHNLSYWESIVKQSTNNEINYVYGKREEMRNAH